MDDACFGGEGGGLVSYQVAVCSSSGVVMSAKVRRGIEVDATNGDFEFFCESGPMGACLRVRVRVVCAKNRLGGWVVLGKT